MPGRTWLLRAGVLVCIRGCRHAWFPPARRGLAIGVSGMGMVGTAISALTTVKLVTAHGIAALFMITACALAAPVLGPVRLRGGSAGSARGAAGLTAEAIGAAREAGCSGKTLARFDSASCNSAVIRTVIRHKAHFSVTVPVNSSIRAAIMAIPEEKWTPIAYPQAIRDDQLECWVSDAEVAETSYTAFHSRLKKEQVTARVIVRRVRARNEQAAQGQDELFPVWRHHAVPPAPVRAGSVRRPPPRSRHRRAGHRRPERRSPRPPAIGRLQRERGLACPRRHGPQPAARRRDQGRDPLREGPHRHRPPRPDHHAARTARRGRGNLILHLPAGHHREQDWLNLWANACGPPATAA